MSPLYYEEDAVHVRVWSDDGHPRAVIIGWLTECVLGDSHLEMVVEEIDRQILRGAGADVAWMDYRPGAPHGPAHLYREIIFGVDHTTDRLVEPIWIDTPVRSLEELLGPVECYPRPAYSAELVEQHLRLDGDQVTLPDDPFHTESLLVALRRANRDGGPLGRVAPLLIELIGFRLAENERVFDDGITSTDDPEWPSHFAARLVPIEVAQADRALLAGPTEFDLSEPDLLALYYELATAHDDARPYGQHPDPQLRIDLDAAMTVLLSHLRYQKSDWQWNPASVRSWGVEAFAIAGKHDRTYLETVQPVKGPPKNEREELLASLFEPSDAVVGRDLDGMLVAVAADQSQYAVQWPRARPGQSILPDEGQIVADGAPGQRPAYIKHPDGHLALLPTEYRTNWNFGYGGHGPGSLASAIADVAGITLRSEAAGDQPVPTRWIEDAVQHSHPQELRIEIADIRRRAHS